MIWLSAEEALMSMRPSAWGPRAIPAIRNIATSGAAIFCATNAASVPIARISPQASSVCWAMAIELDGSICRLIQSLQPCRNFSDRDIGLVEQLAHGEEAVELAGEMPVGDRHASLLQLRGVFDALVAKRITAGGQHIGRRQAGQRFDARRRAAPVVAIGATHIIVHEPGD